MTNTVMLRKLLFKSDKELKRMCSAGNKTACKALKLKMSNAKDYSLSFMKKKR